MIVTLCLFIAVGFGLGLTVRWPILAIVATVSLFGSIVGLVIGANHAWLIAVGWSALIVTLLEAGFMLGSFCSSVTLSKGFLGEGPSSAQEGLLTDRTPQVEFGNERLLNASSHSGGSNKTIIPR
jgi:hypothetical protein